MREILRVLDASNVHVDYHHLHVVCQSIIKSGIFVRVNRFGFGRNRKLGWMKRCSFEELVRNLRESALLGETDDLESNSSCTMLGKHVPIGTHGPFQLFENMEQSNETVAQPQLHDMLPPLTQDLLERIVPILTPPYTLLTRYLSSHFS